MLAYSILYKTPHVMRRVRVKMLAGLALMIQCYVVTEEDNNKLSSDSELFQWLAAALECAASAKLYRGLEFSAVEVVQVSLDFRLFAVVA